MRRRINFVLVVAVTCGLVLAVQHNMLAQDESKKKSQWKMQKAKEISPNTGKQAERKFKTKDDTGSEETQFSGVEQYRAITQNNLFMSLGSGGEVKREQFVLIGTMGRSAFIQMEDSDRSFYVAEGQSFSNDAKLVRVGENSVTIVHEGRKKELELTRASFTSQGGGARGGGTERRQKNSGKNGEEMETAGRTGKERWNGAEKEGRDEGNKKGGDTDWARKMSMDELREVRGKIVEHIEGLKAKGVTDPEEYEGALEKMEVVEGAMSEREFSK